MSETERESHDRQQQELQGQTAGKRRPRAPFSRPDCPYAAFVMCRIPLLLTRPGQKKREIQVKIVIIKSEIVLEQVENEHFRSVDKILFERTKAAACFHVFCLCNPQKKRLVIAWRATLAKRDK